MKLESWLKHHSASKSKFNLEILHTLKDLQLAGLFLLWLAIEGRDTYWADDLKKAVFFLQERGFEFKKIFTEKYCPNVFLNFSYKSVLRQGKIVSKIAPPSL